MKRLCQEKEAGERLLEVREKPKKDKIPLQKRAMNSGIY